jgi:hypothetical protein
VQEHNAQFGASLPIPSFDGGSEVTDSTFRPPPGASGGASVSEGASGGAGGGGDTRGGGNRDSTSSSDGGGGGSGGLSVSGGAGGAEEAGGTGGSAGKRPRYAAAAEGVHVLEEEEVDMVSQVADLGRVEDLGTEAATNKEYWRIIDDWSHETQLMDRALNITRNKISPESTTEATMDNAVLYASMQHK